MAESKAANGEAAAMKPRPVVRLAIFLISHSLIVSVVCCTAGVFALFLLPVLSKNTYISENALMPGSANTMISSQDIAKANKLIKDITNPKLRSADSGIEIPRLIANHMSDLGAEVNYHKFHPQLNQFHPLNFFAGTDSGLSHSNFSRSSCGVNTVGIVRALRGDGKEAIVLVTPYNSDTISPNEAVSLGIVYSVFLLLARVTWLAKDIIWVAADSRFGEYGSVAAWLRDYHAPVFSGLRTTNSEMCDQRNAVFETDGNQFTGNPFLDVFRRAGTMSAALIIKVVGKNAEGMDTVKIHAEASNGQMPNLDLINIVKILAVHKQGLQVKVEKLLSLLDSKFLWILGVLFEFVGKVTRSLNPQWKFGIPVADYIESSATFASSLYLQALGVPTGPHGAFRDYQVDAITLELSPRFFLNNKARKSDFIFRASSLMEGVIRSVNNLLEKFHQSFFLYLLSSPAKFVSVGVYMIPFALLVAPLPLVAASLYIEVSKADDNSDSRSWRWIRAAKQVLTVHLWAALVMLLPHVIHQMPPHTPMMSMMAWLLLLVSHLPILNMASDLMFLNPGEWAILKSVMISAFFIGLCLMSVINFAAAEIGALLGVPMCLLAHPMMVDLWATGNLRGRVRAVCNVALGFVGFPPVSFFLVKGTFGGFGGMDVGEFWGWLESVWGWCSATYLYIALVHLPCWLLCIRILVHRC